MSPDPPSTVSTQGTRVCTCNGPSLLVAKDKGESRAPSAVVKVCDVRFLVVTVIIHHQHEAVCAPWPFQGNARTWLGSCRESPR